MKFVYFLSQQRPNWNEHITTDNLEDLDLINFSQTVDRNEKEREVGDSSDRDQFGMTFNQLV